jgi:hypothetical protein
MRMLVISVAVKESAGESVARLAGGTVCVGEMVAVAPDGIVADTGAGERAGSPLDAPAEEEHAQRHSVSRMIPRKALPGPPCLR